MASYIEIGGIVFGKSAPLRNARLYFTNAMSGESLEADSLTFSAFDDDDLFVPSDSASLSPT